jgi:hypothetical protein
MAGTCSCGGIGFGLLLGFGLFPGGAGLSSAAASSVVTEPAGPGRVGVPVALIDCNGNGRADRRDIVSGFSVDCDGNGVPDECAEFGLTVEAVEPFNRGHEWGYVVTTTGARFEILPGGVTLYQRIDPVNNDDFEQPLPVMEIGFEVPIGVIGVVCESAQSCRLSAASGVQIEIGSDSMGLLSSSEEQPLIYHLQPLLVAPTWFAERSGGEPLAQPAQRFWEDGGGGVSHMVVPGSDVVALGGPGAGDPVQVMLSPGGSTAFAVFPARAVDLESLYGDGARPHVAVDLGELPTLGSDADWDSLAARGFGAVVLFNGLYRGPDGDGGPEPDWIDGVLQYSFGGTLFPLHEALVQTYIDTAHRHGFKVLAYTQPGVFPLPVEGEEGGQELETTLLWMRKFQQEHDLDGWYLDGASPYGWEEWLQNYRFIRALRRQLGDAGILYHHSSVDLWGQQGGDVVLAPLEAWEDYVLRGETEERARVSGSDDPFIANIAIGHGGALGVQKLRSHGSDITAAELARLFQQNLWGFYEDNIALLRDTSYWQDRGMIHWNARREAYRNDPDFNMALEWPPAWYHHLGEVTVVGMPDEVTIQFATAEPLFADVRVVYSAPNYNFNHADGGDQICYRRYECGDSPRQEHFFRVTLQPDRNPHPTTAYRVLLRAYEGTIRECNPGGEPPLPDWTMQGDVWGTVAVTPGDCNDNGVDDATDIRRGTSLDENGNAIPDECE